MKYETPELKVLPLAINAIQEVKFTPTSLDSGYVEHPIGAYADWEE